VRVSGWSQHNTQDPRCEALPLCTCSSQHTANPMRSCVHARWWGRGPLCSCSSQRTANPMRCPRPHHLACARERNHACKTVCKLLCSKATPPPFMPHMGRRPTCSAPHMQGQGLGRSRPAAGAQRMVGASQLTMRSTQRLHTRQWCARGGLGFWHFWQKRAPCVGMPSGVRGERGALQARPVLQQFNYGDHRASSMDLWGACCALVAAAGLAPIPPLLYSARVLLCLCGGRRGCTRVVQWRRVPNPCAIPDTLLTQREERHQGCGVSEVCCRRGPLHCRRGVQ